MVKSVLYIEKEKFLRSMFEVALKARKLEIHTIETLQNNLYLLADLAPSVIIFDLETADTTPDLIAELFLYRQQNPNVKILATGSPEILAMKTYEVDGVLAKPIVVTDLAARISALID